MPEPRKVNVSCWVPTPYAVDQLCEAIEWADGRGESARLAMGREFIRHQIERLEEAAKSLRAMFEENQRKAALTPAHAGKE